MAYYYKVNQNVTTIAELITLIRGFCTHASLAWVESAHTSGSSTQLLLHTANQHMSNYGIMHLISEAGAPNYLHFHAYPPDYDAFVAPATFDSPDTDYLPGGGSYIEGDEYYNSTGSIEHRIDFTLPCNVDLYGDGNSFFIYMSTGSTCKYGLGILLTERENDFGWWQMIGGSVARASVKNGNNIRKGNVYNGWINLCRSSNYPGVASLQFTEILTTANDDWLMLAKMMVVEASYYEVIDTPYIYFCNDNAGRGDIIEIADEDYIVVISGSETSHNAGIAILKGTQIT